MKLSTYIEQVHDAVKQAQSAVDGLSISVPAPIRDGVFQLVFNKALLPRHEARHCPACVQNAMNLASNAVPWPSQPSPPITEESSKERIGILIRRYGETIEYLDRMNQDGH